MRRAPTLVHFLAVVAVLGIASCSKDDEPGVGEARLEVDGVVEITRADGDVEEVSEGKDLDSGDEVRVVSGGATLELHGGVLLELREGRDRTRDSRVRIDEVPSLLAGEVLAQSGDDAAKVESDGTVVSIDDGAGKLARSLALTAGFYTAQGTIESAGADADVEALFKVGVAGLGLVSPVQPIELDATDPWDRRLLGDVIDLDAELQRLSTGFTRQATAVARQVGFYRARFTDIDDGDPVWQRFRAARAPGENLIGLAIVQLGTRDSTTDRQTRVFGFRAAGAGWGMVARREGVDGDDLLSALDDVLAESTDELAIGAIGGDGGFVIVPGGDEPGGPGGGPDDAPGGPTTTFDDPGGGPSPTTGQPGGANTTTSSTTSTTAGLLPPTTVPPTTLPQPPDDGPLPDGTPLDPVTEPIDDLLGGLIP